MSKFHFKQLFLDKIKDLVWMINSEFKLIYANQAYLKLIKDITAVDAKLNESVFLDAFSKDSNESWKSNYERALGGKEFEIDQQFENPLTGEMEYARVTFTPILDEDTNTYYAVCQRHNTTNIVQKISNSKHLMDASLDTFCTIDEVGNFVFVSAASKNHWGYLPEELIGRAYEDFIIEEDLPKTREITKAIIGGAKVKTFINRYLKKDGTIAYNLWSARWDEDTKLMHCVARDNEEKITQDELTKQSEERFKSLVQEGSDLIGIIDQKGNYIYVSPTSQSVLGIAPEELIERNAFDFIHPDDRESTLANLQKIATEKKVQLKPFRFQNNKKEWRWMETILTDMTDNPAVKGIVANSRDVTEKIAEEQKLQLFQKVIDSTIDAIIITEAEPLDKPGPRIVYVNQAFENQTGYTAEEAVGKNPRFLQGVDSDKTELHLLGEKLRRQEPCEITVLNYKKSGEPFWSNFIVSPITDKDGGLTHFISVQRDVTGQKNRELEQRLVSKISRVFSGDEDLFATIEKLCASINTFGKFDVVEFWSPNMEKTELQHLGHYAQNEEFYQDDETKVIFKKGIGLPGKVWKEKKTLLWDEKQISKHFIRKKAAAKTGIKTILGVPLKYKNEVIGVLIIGTKRDRKYLAKYSDILQNLEIFIGSEINRKKLEYDLKFLYNAIPDILCVSDFSGQFLKMNPAGCDLLEYTEEEILYRSFYDFLHPDDANMSEHGHSELTAGSSLDQFENRYITKSGNVIWVSWSCSSDISNGLIYASGKNVTEEKQLRELIKQANTISKIGAWEIDLEQSTIYWSDILHSLHGTDPKTYKPDFSTSLDFYHEDYRLMVEKSFGNSINTGVDFDYEAVLITKDLKERWVHAIGSLETKNGKPHRLYGSLQDITDRKESEIRLETLANNLPGVAFQYVVDPNGTDSLLHVTYGSLKTWGFLAEEVMADNNLVWNQIALGGDLERVRKSIADSIENKTTWTANWRYVMPNKEVAMHKGYGTPTFLADGRIIFHSVILDVTEENQYQRLLLQASNMARIGSWELNLVNQKGDAMYWSQMTKEIFECEENYAPSFEEGFSFFTEESKIRIGKAIEDLVNEGIEFDEQLLAFTAKENERWVRCIGKREWIDNECTKIYGSFMDMHDSKSLELQISEILESISDAFYAVDKNWNFTYFNKQAEVMLNETAERVIGKNFWETFPEKKGTILEEFYKKVISSQENDSIEYYFSGDQNWYDVHAYPSKGGLSVYFKNITVRKRAADELKKAYEEKTTILESIDDAFFAVDQEWIVTYWNKEAENILGFKREEVIGKNLWEAINDVEDSNFYKQYNSAMTTRTSISFQEYSPKYNIWFETSAYPAEKGLSIYFKDITLSKKADLQLIAAKERFDKVTEATNDVIWDWDIPTNELYWGGGVKSQFGYYASKKSPTIESKSKNIHPDDLIRVEKSFYRALENPGVYNWSEEYRYKKSDNSYAYVMDKGVIIRDSESKPIRVVGAMKDLTDQKRTELELLHLNSVLKKYALELERSNEELEQFAFVTSHDLQEPLRMITSFMDLLKRNYGDDLDTKAHQYIHFATDGAKRMKHIILDLLLYSRANKPTQELEEVDLNEVLSDFRQLRKNIIDEKSVVIQSDDLPTFKTHKAPIIQIFHSILDNAIKYAHAERATKVEICVLEKPDQFEFAIKDNGIGIDPQFFEKIFGIFQRLHNRNEYEGTGIGLSVAKRSVEFLGGKIWLTSTVGEGSTFYFTIKK